MNRFVATRQRMLEAERGPVFPILSRFNEIHNHEEMRRTFDVFREVIFESSGTYYVAVPLNAPRAHPEREELRRDAQTLANLCYALEGQGVLTRPWKIAPGLVAQRKLRRQGSKFIECYRDQRRAPVPRAWRRLKALFVFDRGGEEAPAFRIYAFKSGAWPELILGAVMGAAGRIEAERRRHGTVPARDETQSATTGRSSARPQPFDLPGIDAKTDSLREVFKHRPGEPAAATRPAQTPPRVQDRADFRQRFGSYASHAQAELATYRDLDESDEDQDGDTTPAPANSNTAPGTSAPSTEPPDIVVPFPGQRGSASVRTTQALAERLTAALAAVEEQTSEPGIDVELTRETATFRLPVSQATLPAGLAALTQCETSDTDTAAASEAPQLTLAEPQSTQVPETITEDAYDTDVPPETEDTPAFEPPLVLRRMAE
jgi:hypothetical protein